MKLKVYKNTYFLLIVGVNDLLFLLSDKKAFNILLSKL